MSDIVIVSIHWGREYTHMPMSAPGIAPDEPIDLGHFIIDSGADLIVGNHPHWVQGVELYKGGFISYGHGNFIFDQEWSRETKEGVLGNYLFSNKKLVNVWFTPVYIQDYSRPELATGEESSKILNDMREASNKLMQQ